MQRLTKECVKLLSKPINIITIHVYAPATDTEKKEIETFCGSIEETDCMPKQDVQMACESRKKQNQKSLEDELERKQVSNSRN